MSEDHSSLPPTRREEEVPSEGRRRHKVFGASDGGFDHAAFGTRIRTLRERLCLSLSDVAKASGMTKPHIWELERGRQRNPTVRSIWALARALAVSPTELLGLTQPAWTGVLLRTEFTDGRCGAHVIVEAERSDGPNVEVIRSYADVSESSIYHWAALRRPRPEDTSPPTRVGGSELKDGSNGNG